MSFVFRKLYADVVGTDGSVGVAYLSWLDAWGLQTTMAGIELYAPDGKREVMRAVRRLEPLDPDRVSGCWEHRLDWEQGGVALRYAGGPGGWAPTGPAGAGIGWRVLMPWAEATWCWEGRSGACELRGAGYIDWVELRRPPRVLGLAGLEWGRIHLPQGAGTFSMLLLRSGEHWGRAAWDDAYGRRDVADHCLPRRQGGVTCLRFPGPPGGPGRHVVLDSSRTLHAGVGLDRARFPSAGERLATRLLAGPVRERRWLSRAREAAQPAARGWAIHERVWFGASSARYPS